MAISLPYALRIFDYYPKLGYLIWRERPRSHFKTERAWKIWNTRFAGKRAGSVMLDKTGHMARQVNINRLNYLEHHIIWLIMTGHWPTDTIDHKNLDATNNRWGNLRLATRSEQMHNTGIRKNNTSGYKSVSFHKCTGKWIAEIRAHGKRHYLGLYDTPYEAHIVVDAARQKLHGQFARAA